MCAVLGIDLIPSLARDKSRTRVGAEQFLSYGDEIIEKLTNHYQGLLDLDIWANVFKNDEMKVACGNILHIIEILLTTPFTNAKVEKGF